MEAQEGLFGPRQVYTELHANGAPESCAKRCLGWIQCDKGYSHREHPGESPNPAWSSQGQQPSVQEDCLKEANSILKNGWG